MMWFQQLTIKRLTPSIYFFISSHSPLEEKIEHAVHGSTDLDDVYCTVEEITQLLRNLQVEKASGPDHISAYVLKHTAASIAPSVTQLFIQIGKLPPAMEDINGCTNRQSRRISLTLAITDPSHSHAKCLKNIFVI